MLQEINPVITQNMDAWNEVAKRHFSINRDTVIGNLQTPGYFIDTVLKQELLRRPVGALTVGQFNCNNGRETISAHQLGFKNAVGFDFSKEFVEQGSHYAREVGVSTQFVETDIYKIGAEHANSVDHLFATAGALCWMPDLDTYFEIAFRTLSAGGCLTLWETHPCLEMFKPDRDRKRDGDERLEMHYSYFMDGPVDYQSGLDYYSNEIFGKKSVLWYHHKLSDIFSAVLKAGFSIQRFNEYDVDNSIGYREVENFEIRPPMSFILTAVKQTS